MLEKNLKKIPNYVFEFLKSNLLFLNVQSVWNSDPKIKIEKNKWKLSEKLRGNYDYVSLHTISRKQTEFSAWREDWAEKIKF